MSEVDGLEVIRSRWSAPHLRPVEGESEEECLRLATTLAADGRWADVDYRDASRVEWKPAAHVERMKRIARTFRVGETLQGDPRLRDAFRLALRSWDPACPGATWWWSDIGVPRALGNALLLMRSFLSPEELALGDRSLARARVVDPDRPGPFIEMTGQNLVWVLRVQIARGLLNGDSELVRASVERIAGEIRVTEEEGIQVDASFHQHGPQLYSLGYGLGFVVDNAELVRLVEGTSLALPPEKIRLLTTALLDGHAWFGRGPWVDIGAVGRNVARPGIDRRGLDRAAELLSGIGCGRDGELAALRLHLREEGPPPRLGNRLFHRSDMMVQQEETFTLSVKMSSSRTWATECGNDENLMGDHLADGATMLFRRGDEIDGLFPVWDWRRIPGITAVQRDEPMSTETNFEGYRPIPESQSRTAWAGGVSDGRCGFASFDFRRMAPDRIATRKAWLLSSGGLVALGCTLEADEGARVITSVQQCRRRGEVRTGNARENRALEEEEFVFQGPWWVHHDGWMYAFPEGVDGVVRSRVEEGSWRRISGAGSPDPVRAEIFSIWLEHGAAKARRPFSYVVRPASSASDATRAVAFTGAEVLRNDDALQVVAEGDLYGMAFHLEGEWTHGEKGLTVRVDAPCLLLLRRVRDSWLVTVADPRNRSGEVTVAVDDGGMKGVLRFVLPSGAKAGSSVTHPLPFSGP